MLKFMAQGSYEVIKLPRARRVHQSLLSTPPTFLLSLGSAVYHISVVPALKHERLADVLILNGPGTCVSVVIAVWFSRVRRVFLITQNGANSPEQFFGFDSPRIIYVESFARVKTLSLSGKILRRLVDQ